jgi:hypothetical protein
MNKSIYEDYKYSMQDTSSLYVGAKYTLAEILENEEINFKFRLIVEKYIIPEADAEDTLETHLYYLDSESFLVKLYDQMKARVKVSIIEEKKTWGGRSKKSYVTKMLKISELVSLSTAEKEKCGIVIQELKVSKLAMMTI